MNARPDPAYRAADVWRTWRGMTRMRVMRQCPGGPGVVVAFPRIGAPVAIRLMP